LREVQEKKMTVNIFCSAVTPKWAIFEKAAVAQHFLQLARSTHEEFYSSSDPQMKNFDAEMQA
jgi:hypothetical protein